jgi:hypothetical protein
VEHLTVCSENNLTTIETKILRLACQIIRFTNYHNSSCKIALCEIIKRKSQKCSTVSPIMFMQVSNSVMKVLGLGLGVQVSGLEGSRSRSRGSSLEVQVLLTSLH